MYSHPTITTREPRLARFERVQATRRDLYQALAAPLLAALPADRAADVRDILYVAAYEHAQDVDQGAAHA